MWAAGYWGALLVLAVYGLHRVYLTARYWRLRVAAPGPEQHTNRAALPAELPVVTVQLPLYNERYVAGRLLDAVAALDWPRARLEIQILDDSDDDTTELCAARARTLRQQGFDVLHLRRSDRSGFKAGALEVGRSMARGELMLVLDADFVPRPDLLRRTVGHFADPKVGMVQVRWEHLNRNTSMLTRVQALLLDGHFVVEQHVRARTGRFFNFNGTAGLWRREAIESAGGWQPDTLTEDLDLSYRSQLGGWQFVYLLDADAPAELPANMAAFKTQQYRWAKGSIQVARKLLPAVLASDAPVRVKVEALFHLTQNVPYLVTLVLALCAVPALLGAGGGAAASAYWMGLPLALGTTGALAAYCLTSQGVLGRESALETLLRLPALAAITAGISVSQSRAVLEGLAGHRSDFVRTPKSGDAPGVGDVAGVRSPITYRSKRSLVPVAELALATYFAVAISIAVSTGMFVALPILLVFFSGFAYVGVQSVCGN